MAVQVLPTPAAAIVEGLVKLKRVRKGILKADKSDNHPINPQNSLINFITLENSSKMCDNHPTMQPTNSIIPDKAEISVKISKPRSKSGTKGPKMEHPTPIMPSTGPILEITAPTKAIVEMIVDKGAENPINEAPLTIFKDSQITDDVMEPSKRGRGRPHGSLDTVKRLKKGELNKPPVQHGKLGRPLGSRDKTPRRKKSAEAKVA